MVLRSSVALLAVLASGAASAHGYYHGHAYPRSSVGIVIGGPLYGPWPWYGAPYYYPRPYYYYPRPYYYAPPAVTYAPPAVTYAPPVVTYPPATVVAPGSAPVYVERGQPATPQAGAPPVVALPKWYYCPDAKAYYPYVTQCPSPWQETPASPPPPASAPPQVQPAPEQPR